MFTGIIETTGRITAVRREDRNVHFNVQSPISAELRVDQSLSHNGVCLTVTHVSGDSHQVTAVQETLLRSNLGDWQVGTEVNLERCLRADGRLDGHFVQGHVDMMATCTEVREAGGSWYYHFQFKPTPHNEAALLVDKGSVAVNGVSLTVVSPGPDHFSVAIIPYTWEHTTFRNLKAGDRVNLEFDILGKYMLRFLELKR